MTGKLWQIENVSLRGKQGWRLESVTVDILEGATAVIGWSGAGKTSLLNLLVEFEQADSGHVTRQYSCADGRLPVFWVPQNGGLWSHLTVTAQLEAVVPEREEFTAVVREWLERFDLQEVVDSRPHELSQGQRDRLAVARALASNARVLVMDEPLAHVDEARLPEFWNAVRDHCSVTETSLVVATHRSDVVLREAEHAICLSNGEVAFAGSVDELYHHPPSERVASYLGPSNWISDGAAQPWLDGAADVSGSIRPERIAIVADEDSSITLIDTRWAGPLTEVQLQHEASGRRRSLCCTSGSVRAERGQRVAVQLLLALLLCIFQTGCETESHPQLLVSDVEHWSMPAADRRIPAPRSLDIGPDGEAYVLDTAGRVVMFDRTGKHVRDWAMPEYEVGKPEDICMLADGRIAVADTHYHRVMFFDTGGRQLGTLGKFGRGPGEFKYPVALAEDNDQNLYVCEYGDNDRVQKFTRDGKFVCQFGTFGTAPGQFQRPGGIVWHEGKVYVADAINNRIQVFRDDGEFEGVLLDGDKRLELHYPYDIELGTEGDLYVIEYGAGRISKVARNGTKIAQFGTTGTGPHQFVTPWGIAVDAAGEIYVADTGNRRIARLAP